MDFRSSYTVSHQQNDIEDHMLMYLALHWMSHGFWLVHSSNQSHLNKHGIPCDAKYSISEVKYIDNILNILSSLTSLNCFISVLGIESFYYSQFLCKNSFCITWLSNLLNLSIPDECYPRNAPWHLIARISKLIFFKRKIQ
jgi:hypothetical protein